MANYSVRVTNNKPIGKLTDKDWKKIEDEAIKRMFEIIKKHIAVYIMSEENAKSTIVEFDLEASGSKIYRDKEYKVDIGLKNY